MLQRRRRVSSSSCSVPGGGVQSSQVLGARASDEDVDASDPLRHMPLRPPLTNAVTTIARPPSHTPVAPTILVNLPRAPASATLPDVPGPTRIFADNRLKINALPVVIGHFARTPPHIITTAVMVPRAPPPAVPTHAANDPSIILPATTVSAPLVVHPDAPIFTMASPAARARTIIGSTAAVISIMAGTTDIAAMSITHPSASTVRGGDPIPSLVADGVVELLHCTFPTKGGGANGGGVRDELATATTTHTPLTVTTISVPPITKSPSALPAPSSSRAITINDNHVGWRGSNSSLLLMVIVISLSSSVGGNSCLSGDLQRDPCLASYAHSSPSVARTESA